MRRLSNLHLLVLVLAWVVAVLWGTGGLLAATAALLAAHVVLWRADLVQLRTWRVRRLRRGAPTRPVPSYSAIGHDLQMGAHSGREFDFGMRRRLERMAGTRLIEGHGIDLHRDPAAAREVLGDQTWELLDPQRPMSGRRVGGGVPIATLTDIVERLERT